MKKNNPLKKLRLIKKTIAHLNNEQMYAAHGGGTITQRLCTTTFTEGTQDCETEICTNSVTFDCQPTQACA
jgi:hypothetical protein